MLQHKQLKSVVHESILCLLLLSFWESVLAVGNNGKWYFISMYARIYGCSASWLSIIGGAQISLFIRSYVYVSACVCKYCYRFFNISSPVDHLFKAAHKINKYTEKFSLNYLRKFATSFLNQRNIAEELQLS